MRNPPCDSLRDSASLRLFRRPLGRHPAIQRELAAANRSASCVSARRCSSVSPPSWPRPRTTPRSSSLATPYRIPAISRILHKPSTECAIPGPDANYADGRFTDGDDTVPAARKYFGLWIEQFAAMLPSKPLIKNSLDGGTNYAYGNATNGKGTATIQFGPSNSLSVNVNNIGQQITDYLATSPEITDKTLFAVWGGSNDILAANSADDIIKAVIAQAINIQRLIDAGATQFIIPNIPPLGSTPLLNGSPKTSIPATAAAVLYNQALAAALSILRTSTLTSICIWSSSTSFLSSTRSLLRPPNTR